VGWRTATPRGLAVALCNANGKEVAMDSRETEQSTRQRGIVFLSEESHVPIGQVTQLYEHEWAALGRGARISSFLPILTVRNVRRLLRGRRPAQHPTLRDDRLPIAV
jgi:hypothetical protein